MNLGRRLALAAALAIVAACRPPSQQKPIDSGPAEAVSPPSPRSTTPAVTAGGLREIKMKSYSTSWASPTRNSRVAAPRRRFEALVRVTAIDAAPRAVLVNEAGDHVALDQIDRWEIRAANGGAVGAHGPKLKQVPIVMGASSALVNGRAVDFAGRPAQKIVSTGTSDADKTWALAAGATDASFVLQRASKGVPKRAQTADGSIVEMYDATPLALDVTIGRFWGTEPATFTLDKGAEIPGAGCGAIADDGRIAVAMRDKRFLAYDPSSPANEGVIDPVATAQLAFEPTDISVVDGGVAILSAAQSATVLTLVDAAGKEQWHVTVAFAVDSPPIDAGGGRVYLAGSGFAAAEGGKMLWSQASASHVFATALADGSALVAVGAELRAMSRDGAIVQTLRVPEGDPIVAPPAVAADGAAWVATAKGLYVAR